MQTLQRYYEIGGAAMPWLLLLGLGGTAFGIRELIRLRANPPRRAGPLVCGAIAVLCLVIGLVGYRAGLDNVADAARYTRSEAERMMLLKWGSAEAGVVLAYAMLMAALTAGVATALVVLSFRAAPDRAPSRSRWVGVAGAGITASLLGGFLLLLTRYTSLYP